MKNELKITENYNSLFLNNIDFIASSIELINLCCVQNYDEVNKIASDLYIDFLKITELLLENENFFNGERVIVDSQFISIMLSNIEQCCDDKNYVLLSDLFQLQVIPLIKDIQIIIREYIDIYSTFGYFKRNINLLKSSNTALATIIDQHVFDANNYVLEYSDVGYLTLRINKDSSYYFCGVQNPQADAIAFANRYYEPSIKHYIVYGFGMGYHLLELWKLCGNESQIDVYDSDISILKVAFQYVNLNEILKFNSVNIYYDSNYEKLSKAIENLNVDEGRFLMHFPSVQNIRQLTIKKWMEDLFFKDNTIRNELPKLICNFKSNIKLYNEIVDNLKEKFENRTLFIIAAGPSLDKNIGLLKEFPKNGCLIIAVGTVLKKLINLNIIPDYFIVTDPNTYVYRQVEGLEECTIPMLFLSTASRKFAQNYRGKKYIIFQNEFDLAEEYAVKNGYLLYNTGGSVSTVAIDIGIQLECKRIVLLGLDLAYTNKHAHAQDTSFATIESTDNMAQIKSINGGFVAASRAFVWFRNWIENRIAQACSVEIIDATEGGAYIEGTIIMKLKDVLSRL